MEAFPGVTNNKSLVGSFLLGINLTILPLGSLLGNNDETNKRLNILKVRIYFIQFI